MASFQRSPTVPKIEPISIRAAVVLLTRPIASLKEEQHKTLQAICQANPILAQLHDLAQHFGGLIRGEQPPESYKAWLTTVAASNIKHLQTFATELKRDDDAVRAAMISPWSNGQTEGQVNRLKLLKRQMYGRASFNLLRLRVLY
jgi:transposase